MTKLRKMREERDNALTVQTTLAPLGTTTPPLMWGWVARQFSGQGSVDDDERAALEAARERARTPVVKRQPQRPVTRGPW